MQIKAIVDRVASATGVPPDQAEHTVGILLSVLSQELAPQTSARLFSNIDGAEALTQANAVSIVSGGLLAHVAGDFAGARAGVAVAGLSRLREGGLSMAQIEQASIVLLAQVKQGGGAGLAKTIAAALPFAGL